MSIFSEKVHCKSIVNRYFSKLLQKKTPFPTLLSLTNNFFLLINRKLMTVHFISYSLSGLHSFFTLTHYNSRSRHFTSLTFTNRQFIIIHFIYMPSCCQHQHRTMNEKIKTHPKKIWTRIHKDFSCWFYYRVNLWFTREG